MGLLNGSEEKKEKENCQSQINDSAKMSAQTDRKQTFSNKF